MKRVSGIDHVNNEATAAMNLPTSVWRAIVNKYGMDVTVDQLLSVSNVEWSRTPGIGAAGVRALRSELLTIARQAAA